MVIEVIAEQATIDGSSQAPGYMPGFGAVPAPMLREMAAAAQLKPLPLPLPVCEPGYRPSATLARFLRCRDLTCRFPGCDAPAEVCDIDHTIPYPLGTTHPSNLKLLCRFHHQTRGGRFRACMLLCSCVNRWTGPARPRPSHASARMVLPLSERRKWTPIEYVDNDRSATNGKVRPAYQRMLADIRDGKVGALVAWDLDRLYSQPRELEDLIDLADEHRLALAT